MISESKNTFHLTEETAEQLQSFFTFMPPGEFREHLIELYHFYILHEHNNLPHDFHRRAEGMMVFLEWLKGADSR